MALTLARKLIVLVLALTLAPALVFLTGCGFHLRSQQVFPFATLGITPEHAGGVAGDLSRILSEMLLPVAPAKGAAVPEVILDIQRESRQKVIVGVNASGQVREYELRLNVVFKVRTGKGEELVGPTIIEQSRNISLNESAVLSKEVEEGLLYRDMQSDVVQQLLRRLGSLHLPAAPVSP